MGESNNINIRPKDDERSRREIDTLKDETPPAMMSVKSWQEGGGGGRVVFFPSSQLLPRRQIGYKLS